MIAWFRADVDLPKNLFYEKVLFFTQLSYHLMSKLVKKSYMLSNAYGLAYKIHFIINFFVLVLFNIISIFVSVFLNDRRNTLNNKIVKVQKLSKLHWQRNRKKPSNSTGLILVAKVLGIHSIGIEFLVTPTKKPNSI